MSRYRHSSSRKAIPPDATTRWRNLLFNGIPFTGNILRQLAVDNLTDRARNGDVRAAQALAECVTSDLPDPVREKALSALKTLDWQPAIDAAWQIWLDTRNPALEKLLIEKAQPAGHPFRSRAFSLLKLNTLEPAAHISLIPMIIEACQDPDDEIHTRAAQVLRGLTNQAVIDELFSQWAASRSTALADIIRSSNYVPAKPVSRRTLAGLWFGRPEWIDKDSPESVQELLKASDSADISISASARQILSTLQSAAAIDELCRAWCLDRNPTLESIIKQAGYVAQRPVKIRFLTALLTGHIEIPTQARPDELMDLLAACQDTHSDIAANARKAVCSLALPQTQAALCEIAISTDQADLQELAVSSGFLPEQPERQALFLFLTGQLDRYDRLDFDQRLMRAAYETADPATQRRISRAVQTAGKTAYLAILAGSGMREAEFADEDIQPIIRILTQNREWQRLWNLLFDVRLEHAVQILHVLFQSGWQPENQEDHVLFERARGLISMPLTVDRIPLEASIPPAVCRATLKIQGRIYDIAFALNQPLLALGTGTGQIVFWDSHKSKIERILTGAGQPVGKLAFTPEGELISAGRDVNSKKCWIHRWVESAPKQIGYHTGPVTGLFVRPDGSLISTGRDNRVVIWDIYKYRSLSETTLPDWARGAALSPLGDRLVILNQWFSILELSNLQSTRFSSRSGSREIQKSMNRAAVFSPDGSAVLLGQYNGQVVQYRNLEGTSGARRRLVTGHPKGIVAIRFLPDHPLFLTADMSGNIRFHSWPDLQHYKSIQVPGDSLTSVHISPDGAFLAAGFASGSSKSTFTLWDLRVLDLPDIISIPLCQITPRQLAAVISLLDVTSSGSDRLPQAVQNGLELLRLLLQHRYQYEIYVDDIPTLSAGEFDILLEG
jgi:WD40 repeat protein/HEAT repeat protein